MRTCVTHTYTERKKERFKREREIQERERDSSERELKPQKLYWGLASGSTPEPENTIQKISQRPGIEPGAS